METLSLPFPLKTGRYFSGQNYVFDLGCTLFKSGNFQGCIKHLRLAAKQFVENKDFSSYMECYNMLFSALNELGKEELLEKVREEFENNCETYNIQKTPRVLMSNGFYFGILKKDNAKASTYLTEALNRALENQKDSIKNQDSVEELKSKLDIIRCLCAFCHYYAASLENDKCREQINQINIFFEWFFNLKGDLQNKKSHTDNVQLQKHYQSLLDVVNKEYLHINRLNLGIKITEAFIDTDYKKANRVLWESYERANALNEKYLIPYILLYLAHNYFSLDEQEQTRLFFKPGQKKRQSPKL